MYAPPLPFFPRSDGEKENVFRVNVDLKVANESMAKQLAEKTKDVEVSQEWTLHPIYGIKSK